MTANKPSAQTSDDLAAKMITVLNDADFADVVRSLGEAIKLAGARQSAPLSTFLLFKSVRDKAQALYEETSAAMIASVNGESGSHGSFTVVDNSGRASANLKLLKENHPEVYEEIVSWGSPFKSIRISQAYSKKMLGDDDIEDEGGDE